MRFTLAIINPPYGVGGNLAIKFLNKTAEVTDDIRTVLPTSVRKPSSLNKIVGHLHCVLDEDLDSSTFPGGISAVKQYWEVKNTSRFQVGVGEIPMIRKHSDFEFLSYENRFDADVFVGEYGSGPSGSTTGTQTFVVPMNAPSTLYYQCTIHGGMGNTINIV